MQRLAEALPLVAPQGQDELSAPLACVHERLLDIFSGMMGSSHNGKKALLWQDEPLLVDMCLGFLPKYLEVGPLPAASRFAAGWGPAFGLRLGRVRRPGRRGTCSAVCARRNSLATAALQGLELLLEQLQAHGAWALPAQLQQLEQQQQQQQQQQQHGLALLQTAGEPAGREVGQQQPQQPPLRGMWPQLAAVDLLGRQLLRLVHRLLRMENLRHRSRRMEELCSAGKQLEDVFNLLAGEGRGSPPRPTACDGRSAASAPCLPWTRRFSSPGRWSARRPPRPPAPAPAPAPGPAPPQSTPPPAQPTTNTPGPAPASRAQCSQRPLSTSCRWPPLLPS
jgi:hypothetical protein